MADKRGGQKRGEGCGGVKRSAQKRLLNSQWNFHDRFGRDEPTLKSCKVLVKIGRKILYYGELNIYVIIYLDEYLDICKHLLLFLNGN